MIFFAIQILGPNYPIMVLGEHPVSIPVLEVHKMIQTPYITTHLSLPSLQFFFKDAFDSTAPLGFGAANYFLPLSSHIGIAIACVSMGKLSDKYGRRPMILACMYIGAVGSLAKWFLRFNFWGFGK